METSIYFFLFMSLWMSKHCCVSVAGQLGLCQSFRLGSCLLHVSPQSHQLLRHTPHPPVCLHWNNKFWERRDGRQLWDKKASNGFTKTGQEFKKKLFFIFKGTFSKIFLFFILDLDQNLDRYKGSWNLVNNRERRDNLHFRKFIQLCPDG